MTPKWNPTIKTLVKSLEYIEKQNPAKMNSVPLSKVGFKWFWNFKDNGWLNIERSKSDGRVHLVSLTDHGIKLLTILQSIKMSDYLLCHKCGIPIAKFFRVPNKEWKEVTGDEEDQVICVSCYNQMKKGNELPTLSDFDMALKQYELEYHKLSVDELFIFRSGYNTRMATERNRVKELFQ